MLTKVILQIAALFEHAIAVARPYHAGLGGLLRSGTVQPWLSGDVPLVVATSAFGMGVNNGNCRLVFHVGCPAFISGYY